MQCPKCKYVRTESDVGPEYECPKCGIVYAKFDQNTEAKKDALKVRAKNKIFDRPSTEKIPFSLLETIKKNKFAKVITYAAVIMTTSFFVKFIFGEKIHEAFVLLLMLGIFGWIAVKITEKLSSFKKNSSNESELPETPKITACRTCGETVAFTAKICPHCGESKPAPQIKRLPTQVTKKHLIIAAIATILFVSLVSRPEKPVNGSEVLARCLRELGMDPNSSAPASMGDIYAIDKCLNKYGINTNSKR